MRSIVCLKKIHCLFKDTCAFIEELYRFRTLVPLKYPAQDSWRCNIVRVQNSERSAGKGFKKDHAR